MTKTDSRAYMAHLSLVLREAEQTLEKKDAEYGGSWLKRGGVGAFMMLARKWDRIEEQLMRVGYDIFQGMETDVREEDIEDDVRDLMNYLALVLSEQRRRKGLPIGENKVIKPDPYANER